MLIYWHSIILQQGVESAGEDGFHFRNRDFAGQFLTQGGHPFVGETAGIYCVEILEVRVDVQRQAVHRHKAGAFHADGAYFTFAGRVFVNPYSGGAFHSFTLDSVFGDCAYHGLFEQMDIVFNTEVMALQVDNRVCHKLTWTVERDVAAPGYLDKFHSGQLSQHILGMAVAPECEHRRVLDEDEPFLPRGIGAFAFKVYKMLEKNSLPFEGVAVREDAPVGDWDLLML